MNSSIWFDTMAWECFIVHMKGSKDRILKLRFISIPMIICILANSAEADEIPHFAAFRQYLHCLFKDICGYFQCAPFSRLVTGKIVWVQSFDH